MTLLRENHQGNDVPDARRLDLGGDPASSTAFGRRLRQAMENRGIMQAELARKAGMHPNSINRWVKGYGFPGNEALDRLCSTLGVSADWLLRGQDAGVTTGTTPPDALAASLDLEEASRRASRLLLAMDHNARALWLAVGERLVRPG